VAHALVLDPRWLGRVDHASGDGDEPSGKKPQVGLPVVAIHGDGGVAADAPSDMDGESVAEFVFVEVVGSRCGREHGLGRLAHEGPVRGAVVVLVEEGVEADVEVVERAESAGEVQASLAQGAPEALHFSAGGRVVGLGVQEGRAHPGAGEGEGLAAVGGAVVEVEGVGGTVLAYGAHEQAEHVDLALLVHGLEGDDVPGRVVEHAVNAHGFLVTADEQVGSVTDVAVPERAGPVGLPTQPLLAVGSVSQRALVEAARGEEAPQRGGRDDVELEASVGDERVEDQLGRGAGSLPSHVAEQLLLLGGEGPRRAAVGARLGSQRGEPPFLVVPVPALERGHGEGTRRGGARRPEALLAEGLEPLGERAARQVDAREGADDLAAEQRDRFGVILGGEIVHAVCNLSANAHVGRRAAVATRTALICRGITVGGNRRGRGSGSARVKGPAGKGGELHARSRRREGHERGGRALGLPPSRHASGWRARCRGREQPPLGRCSGPAAQGDPRALRRGPHERQRAHACAHHRLCRAQQGPERERETDRRRGVQPPRQDLPRHHEHARAAGLALVPPRQHARQLRAPSRCRRAPHLTLARAVTVNRQLAAVRPTRRAATEAPRRPHLRRRRHL
jgi:hypothetical protein